MNIATVSSRRGAFPILEVLASLMILGAIVLFVLQLSGFSAERQRMPAGMVMAGVPVGGLSREEAQARVEQVYGTPVTILYRDQEIHLVPTEIGLRVNSEAMLSRADEVRTEGTFWTGFWDYIWLRPEQEYSVDLVVDYSADQLRTWLVDIASRYDRPPLSASPALNTLSFQAGQPGYTLDQEASFDLIDAALRRPVNRTVELVIGEGPAPQPDLQTLRQLLIQYLEQEDYQGVASIYVIDLKTGEEMELNIDLTPTGPVFLDCEIAYAGMSVMKIPIMVEMFRYLSWVPSPDEYKILTETMTLSGNFTANLMMREIGYDDAYRGAETITRSMRYLGLENTFIAAPYDDEEDPVYISTPAREAARAGTCVNTRPDAYMQTTVSDMAMLLDMIYQCYSTGGGGLVAAYPGDFTQAECEMMINLMTGNDEGVLILAGVPTYVEVAHKHGWISDTHADAGIVLSPGGDYVLAMFMWDDVDWLDYQISFPIMMGISEATFNFFNPDLVLEPRRGFEPQ